ncbi:acyl-CoA carboxylase subunit epsilon [Gordonia sp. NB41Y]|uniref:acyl-CoA carboxylase subunit epsilon n=1 Tax=Gordonia sp. NB41Y TaxID=875808 RepID=UPI0002BD44F0|nr:acyl-CoA carboxylase subunit epsilon [Gordonia sp. NB41Y]WLP91493.1 acyl-CoA carboxylase subunit epsilon [Gordonia sp. NB41Y]
MSADETTGVSAGENAAEKAPFLRVVSGNPTAEDVAVLVSVLAAAGGSGPGPADTEPRNEWGRPVDRLRPQWGSPLGFTNLGR